MFFALPPTPHSFMFCINLYQFLSLLFIDPLAQKVVGIVRVDMLTFKAHDPYLNPYVMYLSPHKTGYSGKLTDGAWCICVSGVTFFLPFFPYIIDKAFGMLLGHIFRDVESCSPCSLIPYAPVGALSTNFII